MHLAALSQSCWPSAHSLRTARWPLGWFQLNLLRKFLLAHFLSKCLYLVMCSSQGESCILVPLSNLLSAFSLSKHSLFAKNAKFAGECRTLDVSSIIHCRLQNQVISVSELFRKLTADSSYGMSSLGGITLTGVIGSMRKALFSLSHIAGEWHGRVACARRGALTISWTSEMREYGIRISFLTFQ